MSENKILNCWEVMECGCEPDGKEVSERGVCPAATNTLMDGINDGKNAGRFCWTVAGTLCEGEVQGKFAVKIDRCYNCKFYKMVTGSRTYQGVQPG